MGHRSEPTRKFVHILKNNNYYYVRSSGSHDIYSNGINSITVTVPEMNKMLRKRLIKENNLIVN